LGLGVDVDTGRGAFLHALDPGSTQEGRAAEVFAERLCLSIVEQLVDAIDEVELGARFLHGALVEDVPIGALGGERLLLGRLLLGRLLFGHGRLAS
jgi:hypothetical protein